MYPRAFPAGYRRGGGGGIMGGSPAPVPPRPVVRPVPAPVTADAFVACLRQSGLVEEDALDAFLDGREGLSAKVLARDAVAEKHLTKWQADKLLAGRCRGFRLGSYTLLSLLGKGGMSAVYLGEHAMMHRKCAVKVLPAKLLGGGSHLQRFLREARAVAALDHPNIVRAYDVASEGEGPNATYYLVMELVVGRSLYDLVKRDGPPGPDRVRRIGRESALGLAHAHAAGIVHRDVKPGNILLANSGAVKVTDLGLASGQDEEHSLTVAHDEKVLGTADYLAPEQALDSHAVDHRADIYGLGCTLYFALCGHGPFTDGTLTQRLMAHQTQPAPPIETVAEAVPADLAAVIGRMLEKDPGNRFQTMEEVAAALSDATAGAEGGPLTPAPGASADREEPTERELSDFLQHLGPSEDGSDVAQSGVLPAVKTVPGGRSGSARRSGRGKATKSGRRKGRATSLDAADEPPFVVADDEPTPLPHLGDAPDAGSARRPGRARTASGGPSADPKWPLIAAAVAGLAVAAAALFLFLPGGDEPDAPDGEPVTAGGDDGDARGPVTAAAAGGPLTVGPDGDFPTLAAALDHLRETYDPTDDEVRVVSLPTGVLREGIVIDNADFSFPNGVKIVGAAAGTTLAPPGDGPAVSLRALNRFALENVAVDGEGRAVAAELGGFLTDVAVSGLTIGNVSGVGLLLDGVAANGLPIAGLTVTAADGATDAVGVRFAGTGVGGVTIGGGTLAGPFAAGLAVAADAANLTLDGLAIGSATAGVRFGDIEIGETALRDLTFDGAEIAFLFTGTIRGEGGLTVENPDYGEGRMLDAGPDPDSVRNALGDPDGGLGALFD